MTDRVPVRSTDMNVTLEAAPTATGPQIRNFEDLYRQSRDDLYSYVAGLLRDRVAAEDVTALAQAKRVKRGIARTFQINQLFRGLTVQENVCIAVSERLGVGGSMLRPAGKRADVIAEASRLIEVLKLGEDAGRRIVELPYGRQRLVEIAIALGLNPRALLLDEPAAGIPGAESHILLDAIAALPKNIAVLIIEHDMDLVFRFAERITVLVSGAIFAEGTPTEIAANREVRSVYLGSALDA